MTSKAAGLGCAVNVIDAARKRIRQVLADFDRVYVSFSGGKDSGVLLHLALDEAAAAGQRIGVFHIDYEAQYRQTTDYVDETLRSVHGVADVYRVCLPLAAQCATSMHQDHWIPWEQSKRAIWVRAMPDDAISEAVAPRWFRAGMWDYEFQDRFAAEVAQQSGGSACCLVGIRADESLNRWRAIHRDDRSTMHRGKPWTRITGETTCNAYPIFDWSVEDIWTANAKFGWPYNKLYDLFYQAGVPVGKMRVASPFNDAAPESLHLYRAIDPNTWGRMVGRVNGVNFTGLYGGTKAMGWKNIQLPPGHTWRSYVGFLLSTLPPAARANYVERFRTSIDFWRDVGGALSDETIGELQDLGICHVVDGMNARSKGRRSVRFPVYPDDANVSDFKSVPSYKRMAVCILKNDHLCKYMGFSPTKTDTAKREAATRKYMVIA